MAHKACDPFTPMGFPRLSLWADALQILEPSQGRARDKQVWEPASLHGNYNLGDFSHFSQASHPPDLSLLSPAFLLLFSNAFLSPEQWKLKHNASLSFLKTPSQGGRVSPIFMSSKWLLSKWGHTKSHSRCHKYKWLDIGGNTPSGEIMGCTLAVMVDHTESSYISTGKVIQAFGGDSSRKKSRSQVQVNPSKRVTCLANERPFSGCWRTREFLGEE